MPLTSERTYDSCEGGPCLVWPSLGIYIYFLKSGIGRWNVHGVEQFNPFTATACKISGLKNAHMHSHKQYLWWSYNKSTFNTVQFGRSHFTWSCERGKFGTFIGCFPSDGTANMAVKEVIIMLIYVRARVCVHVWEHLILHTHVCWHVYPTARLPAPFGSQLCSRLCHFSFFFSTFLFFSLLFCPLVVCRGNVHVYLLTL